MLADLSEEQRLVVTAPAEGPHLLVLAGPGSGKTRTIVERIRWLVTEGHADPGRVLAMTFTRKAAGELRHRLAASAPTGAALDDVWSGTYHSVCADILGEWGHLAGVPLPLRILDERGDDRLLRAAVARAGIALPDREWDRNNLLKELRERISRRKREGVAVAPRRRKDRQPDEVVAAVDACFTDLLARDGLLDYDDLVVRAAQTLTEHVEAREAIRAKVRHLFLDEFHDMSPEQYRLTLLLLPPRADEGGQALAVADEDQRIYGWRGADPDLLLRFRREYRPQEATLSHNFRSTPQIVAVGNEIIRHGRDGRRSTPSRAVNGDGFPVDCFRAESAEQEAERLVALVRRAVEVGRYHFGEIAVLYRTHDRANAAEDALLAAAIPVWRVQPGRFFAQESVREALRYLDLALALHDDGFRAALNWPRVLVDELTMIDLRRSAAGRSHSLCEHARAVAAGEAPATPLTRRAVRDLLAVIDHGLSPVIDRPVAEIVERLLAILFARRNPIADGSREDLHGVSEFLAQFLQPAADALHAALAAGRTVEIAADGSPDAACAAAILRHLLTYWQRPEQGAGPPFTVVLGQHREATEAGLGIGVRETRAFAYSIGTQAWLVARLVLMADETLDRQPFVLFDLETGSVHPSSAEIVEVAALRVVDGVEVDRFRTFVRPSHRDALTPQASQVNGIRWLDVAEADPPDRVLPRLLAVMGDATVVGHNIEAFDYPVLRRVATQCGMPAPSHHLLDTLRMARRLFPTEQHHRLADLALRFGIADTQRHRALDDVRMNAAVLAGLLAHLRRERLLDAMSEVLPLVAASVCWSGVPLEAENELLVEAGARAWRLGQGREAWDLLRPADPALRPDAEAWLAACPCADPEADAAWETMRDEWRAAAARYASISPDRSLAGFLRWARLAEPIDFLPDPEADADPSRTAAADRVAMMTVHTAKGKEWPLVFIIGAEDGSFPMTWTEDVEEDRRVLYVGVTRAQRRLCILWSRTWDGKERALSPFLRGCFPDGHGPQAVDA